MCRKSLWPKRNYSQCFKCGGKLHFMSARMFNILSEHFVKCLNDNLFNSLLRIGLV